jgi:hypothetical protein
MTGPDTAAGGVQVDAPRRRLNRTHIKMMSDKDQSPRQKVSWVLVAILAAIVLAFYISSFLVQANG